MTRRWHTHRRASCAATQTLAPAALQSARPGGTSGSAVAPACSANSTHPTNPVQAASWPPNPRRRATPGAAAGRAVAGLSEDSASRSTVLRVPPTHLCAAGAAPVSTAPQPLPTCRGSLPAGGGSLWAGWPTLCWPRIGGGHVNRPDRLSSADFVPGLFGGGEDQDTEHSRGVTSV